MSRKYPPTVREKPCCGYTGAMRINGDMACANPEQSICWSDKVNMLSKEVDIVPEKKDQKHAAMKLYELLTGVEMFIHAVISGIVVWGLTSWFGVVEMMKEVLGPLL